MKATLAQVKKLTKDLKRNFSGKSYAETLERIVLGYENAFRTQDGRIGIEVKGGNYKYLWTDF